MSGSVGLSRTLLGPQNSPTTLQAKSCCWRVQSTAISAG